MGGVQRQKGRYLLTGQSGSGPGPGNHQVQALSEGKIQEARVSGIGASARCVSQRKGEYVSGHSLVQMSVVSAVETRLGSGGRVASSRRPLVDLRKIKISRRVVAISACLACLVVLRCGLVYLSNNMNVTTRIPRYSTRSLGLANRSSRINLLNAHASRTTIRQYSVNTEDGKRKSLGGMFFADSVRTASISLPITWLSSPT